ncbi:DUF3261 domain-containing protein [Fontimonas sp. SYSU GA230001]|uniref:DUF3261 domain-containing protein n=1 Tax=Fontimonas sp. SYSU GA230001 TaxID=3142450 RepID=UPI0032B3C191
MKRCALAGAARGRRAVLGSLLLAGALLSACAAAPPAPDAARSGLPILPPSSLGAARRAEQVLYAAYAEREAALHCILDVNAERLRVIGLTALGQRVFTLEQDAAGVRVERAPFAPGELQPQDILADIQLAYWPLATLQAALPQGVRLTEPRAGLRRLYRGPRLVAEVHQATDDPWNGRLWLVNLEHGYSLDITSRPLP